MTHKSAVSVFFGLDVPCESDTPLSLDYTIHHSPQKACQGVKHITSDLVTPCLLLHQSQYIEEELRKHGLDCVVPGNELFWSHEEVQDIVAFLRVIADPQAADSDLLQAVLTQPPRGVEAGRQGSQRAQKLL